MQTGATKMTSEERIEAIRNKPLPAAWWSENEYAEFIAQSIEDATFLLKELAESQQNQTNFDSLAEIARQDIARLERELAEAEQRRVDLVASLNEAGAFLMRVQAELHEARERATEAEAERDQLLGEKECPDIPACPIHEAMLMERRLPTPLDQCIVCTRNERDELRAELERERGLGTGNPKRWRVGGKVPLNVYEDNVAMFQCHTPEDAERIVEMLNLWRDGGRIQWFEALLGRLSAQVQSGSGRGFQDYVIRVTRQGRIYLGEGDDHASLREAIDAAMGVAEPTGGKPE